jgi:hypothetical protein
VIAALLLLLPSHAFSWGSQGHQALADAAQTRLDEEAQAALARILVGGHSVTLPPGKLAIASTWPDEIRGLKSLGVPSEPLRVAGRHRPRDHPCDHRPRVILATRDLLTGAGRAMDRATSSATFTSRSTSPPATTRRRRQHWRTPGSFAIPRRLPGRASSTIGEATAWRSIGRRTR